MSDQIPPMTEDPKRLLWFVCIMGGVLIVLFIAVLGTIAWQLAHLH